MSEPTRDELLAICRDGVVPEGKWSDRDSSAAQLQLGQAHALLAAGCEFHVIRKGDMKSGPNTLWVRITYRGFGYFDYDGELESETFYLPTRARLESNVGRDWY